MTKTVVVVNVLHWSVSILKKRQIIFKGEGGGKILVFLVFSCVVGRITLQPNKSVKFHALQVKPF